MATVRLTSFSFGISPATGNLIVLTAPNVVEKRIRRFVDVDSLSMSLAFDAKKPARLSVLS